MRIQSILNKFNLFITLICAAEEFVLACLWCNKNGAVAREALLFGALLYFAALGVYRAIKTNTQNKHDSGCHKGAAKDNRAGLLDNLGQKYNDKDLSKIKDKGNCLINKDQLAGGFPQDFPDVVKPFYRGKNNKNRYSPIGSFK